MHHVAAGSPWVGMHRTLRVALELQERGVRVGVRYDPGAKGRAEQHFRRHRTGPTERVDGRSLERRILVPAERERNGQLDRQVCGG